MCAAWKSRSLTIIQCCCHFAAATTTCKRDSNSKYGIDKTTHRLNQPAARANDDEWNRAMIILFFTAKIHYYVSFSRRIAARFAIAQKIAHTETSAQKKSSQKRIRNAIKIPKQQVVCGLTRLCSILHSLSASFKSKLKKPCTFGEQINNKAKKKTGFERSSTSLARLMTHRKSR